LSHRCDRAKLQEPFQFTSVKGVGVVGAIQVWNPDDWELFALSLLQSRHGALSVNKIPAAHKGDFGLDYYCSSQAVAYQCYSVREPTDIATRADRQKKKITIDTRKLVLNGSEVSRLFMGVPIKYWVLLAPVHDSKEVNLHCANKALEIRALKCAHLDNDFEVVIQDQASFAPDAVAAGMSSLATVTLDVPQPTSDQITQWQAGSPDLLANATSKLMKRVGPKGTQEAVAEAVRCFLQGNALLDSLRSNAPDLHEKIIGAVAIRYRRLNFAGPQGGPAPGSILNTEIDNLIAAIKTMASSLSQDNAEQIALGTVSEWILRCPLDFPTDVA
jgi:hypothetical protein